MPTSTETEKWAEWVYLVWGWVTDRAISTSKQITRGGKSFWTSQRNDRFGMFDLIALNPETGKFHLVQVTRGENALSKRKTKIKKWCEPIYEDALKNMGISLFLYRGKPRKHFERWRLFYRDGKLKWVRMEDIKIPTKKEVESLPWNPKKS